MRASCKSRSQRPRCLERFHDLPRRPTPSRWSGAPPPGCLPPACVFALALALALALAQAQVLSSAREAFRALGDAKIGDFRLQFSDLRADAFE
jgi:hypothetical protein